MLVAPLALAATISRNMFCMNPAGPPATVAVANDVGTGGIGGGLSESGRDDVVKCALLDKLLLLTAADEAPSCRSSSMSEWSLSDEASTPLSIELVLPSPIAPATVPPVAAVTDAIGADLPVFDPRFNATDRSRSRDTRLADGSKVEAFLAMKLAAKSATCCCCRSASWRNEGLVALWSALNL